MVEVEKIVRPRALAAAITAISETECQLINGFTGRQFRIGRSDKAKRGLIFTETLTVEFLREQIVLAKHNPGNAKATLALYDDERYQNGGRQ